jgi:hypothetical protein
MARIRHDALGNAGVFGACTVLLLITPMNTISSWRFLLAQWSAQRCWMFDSADGAGLPEYPPIFSQRGHCIGRVLHRMRSRPFIGGFKNRSLSWSFVWGFAVF